MQKITVCCQSGILEYKISTRVSWIQLAVQWESDLWTLTAIRSYYGACKFSHNDCTETSNGKINHRSMHLLRSHQRPRGKWGERIDTVQQQWNTHCTGKMAEGCWLGQWNGLETGGNRNEANDEIEIYCGNSLNQYSPKIKRLNTCN